MRIGSAGQYGGVYESYRLNAIPKVDIDTVKKQAMEVEKVSLTHDSTKQERIDHRSKKTDLENISLDFNTGMEFDFIGRDSSIQSLDVQKAVSDMKKDVILQEYQYFVGDIKNRTEQIKNQDGIVIQK